MAKANSTDSGLNGQTGDGKHVGQIRPEIIEPMLRAPHLGKPQSADLVNCTNLTVRGGGTGATAFSPYSVVVAGKNSCEALSGICPDEAGTVFMSNGINQYPTFQKMPRMPGRLLSVKRITKTGLSEYVTSSEVGYLIIELVGGGGAGAGYDSSGLNESYYSFYGAGGGGGSYVKLAILNPFKSYAVMVGNGGAGKAAQGEDGGITTFGSFYAEGGKAAKVLTREGFHDGALEFGLGGIAQTNFANLIDARDGANGHNPRIEIHAGVGGQSYGYPAAPYIEFEDTLKNGIDAKDNTGVGGSGGYFDSPIKMCKGGNGGSGLIIVWEYS